MVKSRREKKVYKGCYVPKRKKQFARDILNSDGINTIKAKKKSNEENFGNLNKKSKVTAKQLAREFLNLEQRAQLNKSIKYYNSYTNDQLKELLAKNRQLKTGNRRELLERCAEGKLLVDCANVLNVKGGT